MEHGGAANFSTDDPRGPSSEPRACVGTQAMGIRELRIPGHFLSYPSSVPTLFEEIQLVDGVR